MPKFSIVIPVYNVATCLRACLDSLRKQSFEDWEAVCVDDGSTDASGRILDEYMAKDSRFRVVHKMNGGPSSARNAACDIAQGEWIVFVDSDDVIAHDWLKAIELATHKNPDWIKLGCTWWWPKEEGDVPPDCGMKFRGEGVLQCYSSKELLSEMSGQAMPFQHVYRRATIGEQRFAERVCGLEDEIFLLAMQTRLTTACVVNYCGYFYRIRSSSLTRSNVKAQEAIEYLEALKEVTTQKDFSIAPQTLTKIVNSTFCSKLGLGLSRKSLDEVAEVKSHLYELRKSGCLALRYVPRLIDKVKWLLFMATGNFWSFVKLKRIFT